MHNRSLFAPWIWLTISRFLIHQVDEIVLQAMRTNWTTTTATIGHGIRTANE